MFEALKKLAATKTLRGFDGFADGLWVTRRDGQSIIFNTTGRPVRLRDVEIPPHEIVTTR
jgi:hypothetical protein